MTNISPLIIFYFFRRHSYKCFFFIFYHLDIMYSKNMIKDNTRNKF